MNDFTKKTFANGVRYIAAPMKGIETATILVMFGAGSRYETPETNGMSHFLEHMFFKGTQKRPTSLDITKELDGVGAEFNAFTSKDHTGYYIKVASQHLPLAIDVVSDMLLNSKFDETELEKEKGVIVEEINMYRDNPMMYVSDIFEEEMYKGNSLGWLISGSHETVRASTRQAMVDYKNTHYRGDNTVVALAGNLPDNVEQLVEAHFSLLPGEPKPKSKDNFEFPKFDLIQNEPRLNLLQRKSEQAQIGFGFPAYSYFHPDETAQQVLATILGGNMSSRLFIEVREERGLAYMVRAGVNKYQDVGNFMVQAGLDKSRLVPAIEVIRQEMEKLKSQPVAEDELQRAKDYLQGKIAISLEDSSHVAQWYSELELLTYEIKTPTQKIEDVQEVTSENVQRVAEELFDPKKATLAVIGPFENADEFRSALS